MDTISGNTNSRDAFRLDVAHAIADQQVAADGDRDHQRPGATGIRFHQAACVYPCEFSTSFMPATANATDGCRLRRWPGLDRGP